MFFEQYSHEPNIATARFWLSIKKIDTTPFNEELLRQKQSLGRGALKVMEDHLSSRLYFVGERYSIADIALYAYSHVAEEGSFDLNACPATREWLSRVRLQPRHVTIDQWRDA